MVVQELVALLGFKTDESSMNKAKKGTQGLVGLAKAAAAAFAAIGAVRWVKGVVEQVAKAGDRLDKMSLRTGIAFEALQQFSHAAELSGASLNDVETSIKRLQTAQSDAAIGLETYTREFKRLGVDIKETDGSFKDTTKLLLEIADGMNGLESDTERTAVAVKLLGRSGTNLIPLLKQGGDAVRDMMLEVQALGGMMSDDLRAASAKFIDNQQRMKVVVDGVKYAIGEEFLPVLNDILDSTISLWKANGEVIRQNVGRFFKGLGETVKHVSGFFQKLTGWLFKFWKNLDPLTKSILGVTTVLSAFILLFKLGPVGKFLILLGAIILAIEDFQVFLEGGNSALGKFLDWVKEITGIDFATWIHEAADAFNILAADPEPFDWVMYFEEVSKVIDEHLEAASTQWKNVWKDIWKWFSNLFESNPVQEFIGAVRDNMEEFWGFLRGGFDDLITFLIGVWEYPRGAWENFYNSFFERIKKMFGAISKLGGAIKGLFGFGGEEETRGGAARSTVQGARVLATQSVQGASASGAGIKPLAPSQIRASGGAGGSYTNAPVIQQTVNAAPGMSERGLARESSRQIERAIEKQNRNTLQAYASRKAG